MTRNADRTATSLKKLSLKAGIAAMALVVASPALAQPTDFDIDPQPLADALREFAQESGREILFSSDVTNGKRSSDVEGRYEPDVALRRLLRDTGLRFTVTSRNAFLVQDGSSQESSGNQANSSDRGSDQRDVADEEPEIVVTGTNIRGVAPVGSPLQQYDRVDIERSGRGTVQEFFETIPQNFGGGVSQDGIRSDTGGDFNRGGRAGLNLRGVGNGATLVLLNGNRLAAGVNGAFVDVSMIPVSAIERIDVLPDGASAIYGSDAISGVVNLVLRDDFDGVESTIRLGSVTEGSQTDVRLTQTLGESWQTGRVLVSYDYFNRTELSTDERSFSEAVPGPSSLVPNSENHSIFGSIFQDVSGDVEVFATGFYSTRATDTINLDTAGIPLLSDSNIEQFNISSGLSARMGSDWIADVAATFAQDDSDQVVDQQSSSLVQEAINETSLYLVDAKLGGTLFTLPGGPVRVAFGGQYRREELQNSFLRTIAGVAGDPGGRQSDREVIAAFGEIVIPILGGSRDNAMGQRLDVSIAARYEDYSDFGSTFDPKIGISYEPVEGFTLRGSYSTSFRAPLLFDLLPENSRATALSFPFIPDPTSPNGFIPFVLLSGTNPGLNPETSENWTVGVDLAPPSVPGLSINLTYFDISYEGRIASAVGPNLVRVFVDPVFQPIITRNPDTTSVSDIFALPTFNNPFGLDPSQIEAIVDNRLTNLSSTNVKGIDFSIGYQLDTDIGSFSLQSAGSLYLDFEDRFTATSDAVTVVDTAFNPVDLRFRNSVTWTSDGWAANLAVNYVDSYEFIAFPLAEPISSWTTVDFGLSYRIGDDESRSLFQNTNVALNVQNLFDEDPPIINSGPPNNILFDAANANPLGRFVSFQITKRW